jgi:hypothetical protein
LWFSLALFTTGRFRNLGCKLSSDLYDVVTIGGGVLVAPCKSKTDAQIDFLDRLLSEVFVRKVCSPFWNETHTDARRDKRDQ